MIYPRDFEQRIGFEQVRDAVSRLCGTEGGRRLVGEATFETDRRVLGRVLGRVAEMRDILMLEGEYPGGGYIDMNRFLRVVRVEGRYLEPAEMVELGRALELLGALSAFFRGKREETAGGRNGTPYPLLDELTAPVEDFGSIRREIARILDPEAGTVRDNASSELAQIRRTVREKAGLVDKRLQAILRQAQAAGLVDPESEIAVRDGRTVIPVAAVNKR